MKEDEVIGKKIKDYKLNDDEQVASLILEDGTEVLPLINGFGVCYLKLLD